MLDAIVGFVVVLLVGAGILVMIGPRSLVQRLKSVPRFSGIPSLFEPRRPREVVAPTLNPKTQRGRRGSNREGIPLKRRSEEHTSELQSRSEIVCRLLLEKKKNT